MAADRMHPQQQSSSGGRGLDPDEVGRKSFETAFRGYDPGEVQAYLLTIATALRTADERVFELETRLVDAERAAEQAGVIDDARLTAALGDEVAGILESARQAAAQLRARAEPEAAGLVRQGEQEAIRVRREADALLEQRTAEANAAAATIAKEADELRTLAAADAAAVVEAGKAAGRQIIAEAPVVRERILKDLARRRRQARQQIEQLRAGRERLLDAYRVVRETSEKATEELEISLPAAKAAAETAGHGIAGDDDLSVQQLESMLDAARDAGLIDTRADAEEAAAAAAAATADEREVAVDDAEPDEIAVESEAPSDAEADEPYDEEQHADELEVEAEPARAEVIAEPPVEGRRSSSVRVFRRDTDRGAGEAATPDPDGDTHPQHHATHRGIEKVREAE
jgi:DivIVA domain-containing protein